MGIYFYWMFLAIHKSVIDCMFIDICPKAEIALFREHYFNQSHSSSSSNI